MVFSSLTFLCVFLPVVLLASFLIPGMRAKNVLLILASLFFYAYGEPIYVLLMLVSVLCNWGFGLLIGKAKGDAVAKSRQSKLVLALAIILNLGFLAVFKYAGLLSQSLGLLLGTNLPFADIALPIGISFYTFQALSYCIDVYREVDPPERSLLKVLLFISFFPQLIAGPIIKYHDVNEQLSKRTITVDGVAAGLRRFVVGLAKKVLIANTMGAVADSVYGAPQTEINIAVAWIGALAYLAQIYFDFSGYSDMAIGLARCFGFQYKENFNYPYISVSIREFWRRWHISLSTWFKEYLYIPLGGNRKGRPRAVCNKLVVFGLCGLWHGASWTFLAWGLFHGLFLLLEEYLPIRRLPKALGLVYALLVVCIGFVLFRAEDFSQALFMLQQMFGGWHFEPLAVSRSLRYLDVLNLLTFGLAILAATPLVSRLKQFLSHLSETSSETSTKTSAKTSAEATARTSTETSTGASRLPRLVQGFSYLGTLVLFGLCFLALSGGGYNPFIYFRF